MVRTGSPPGPAPPAFRGDAFSVVSSAGTQGLLRPRPVAPDGATSAARLANGSAVRQVRKHPFVSVHFAGLDGRSCCCRRLGHAGPKNGETIAWLGRCYARDGRGPAGFPAPLTELV